MSDTVEQLNLIISTIDNPDQARTVIGALLEKKLIACGSISSAIESHFMWEGQLQQDVEYQLFLKTPPATLPELMQTLERIHPYDCPEILCITTQSSTDYAQWAAQQCA